MKHMRLLCLSFVFVLVTYGCKKKEPEPAQQAVIQKQPKPTEIPAPAITSTPAQEPTQANAIETGEQTQPIPADTQREPSEIITATQPTQPNNDPELIASLQQAAGSGDVEKIRSLIDKGVDVNTKANSGASLLHIALVGGHEEAAVLLISKGADTHAEMTGGTTTLHFAVLRNCREIASFLIDDGLDVNAMDISFGTPLHIAASTGHIEIAEMLIAKGADVNITNKRNQTPLTIAKQKRDKAMIELLQKHGAE